MKWNALTDRMPLSNGESIPCVGFGTWQAPPAECEAAVKYAIEAGYRHIDGAAVYGNEKNVGNAIRAAGVAREDLFLTSKLWNAEQGYESTLAAFEKTCADLGTDYLDLYLIHWPSPAMFREIWKEKTLSTWRAMEKLHRDGRIRSIGLSNFLPMYLHHILENCEVKPVVNQIELHPGLLQWETVDMCRKNDILIEAYSPLGSGQILQDPAILALGEKYSRPAAQVILRWLLQKDILPLPKSVTPSRIADNTKLFDFEVDAADCAALDTLPENRVGWHPSTADF